MWYVFNSKGTCVGVLKEKPTETDLSGHNATCAEYEKEVNTSNLRMANGVLVVI